MQDLSANASVFVVRAPKCVLADESACPRSNSSSALGGAHADGRSDAAQPRPASLLTALPGVPGEGTTVPIAAFDSCRVALDVDMRSSARNAASLPNSRLDLARRIPVSSQCDSGGHMIPYTNRLHVLVLAVNLIRGSSKRVSDDG